MSFDVDKKILITFLSINTRDMANHKEFHSINFFFLFTAF